MNHQKTAVNRWKRIFTVFILVMLGLPLSWVAWKVYTTQQYLSQVSRLRSTIDSLNAHSPDDVPVAQWTEAVQWTSNLVVQDFSSSQPEECLGLQELNQQLELKKNEPIDLAKLCWIWDQIEAACGGPNSWASRFRKVKLMTKGPITDERLPSLWALERCAGLDLSGTGITGESVTFLQSLPNLERLDINKTGITAAGAKELQNSRPNLRVFHETIQ